MKILSLTKLIDTNLHIGHKLNKWDPKNKKYIYKIFKDNCIIDLIQTIKQISKAYIYVYKLALRNESILYIGSYPNYISSLVALAAKTSGNFYINTTWKGGTLTNWPYIRNKLILLKLLKYFFKTIPKNKSVPPKLYLKLKKVYIKLNKNLKGLLGLNRITNSVFIVTPKVDKGALKESISLNRILIGIVDTNVNPELFSYPIVANDDNLRSVELIIQILTTASIHGVINSRLHYN